ncbi:hypothetical protein O4J55_13320 [Paracoccus sp. PXZ]|uniref:hypothetical protein n=1 Tax=Paracoccus sp. MKU1 TaxID=1745182 RepID=UPI0007192304|nr:hypothetical protein [Paracoccus sp. MKU1]
MSEVTRLRRASTDAVGLDEVRAAMGEAIERLSRLEEVMCEMIRTGLAPTVGGGEGLIATGPPPCENAEARALAAQAAILVSATRIASLQTGNPDPAADAGTADPILGYISRRMLVELAIGLGEIPLHARPRANRGLRLVGGRPRKGSDPAAPLYLRLDRHLRLPLDCGSNALEIERRLGGRWHRTGLHAIKDGMGGIELDIAMLEHLAGPFSPELRRALTLDPKPPPDRIGPPSPQPQ